MVSVSFASVTLCDETTVKRLESNLNLLVSDFLLCLARA